MGRNRFHRELEILSQLDHPNVVTLLEWPQNHDELWYISELGKPFRGYWKNLRDQHDGSATLFRAIEILDQLAQGLGVCHEAGVVHRDLKPSNVVMCQKRFQYGHFCGVAGRQNVSWKNGFLFSVLELRLLALD